LNQLNLPIDDELQTYISEEKNCDANMKNLELDGLCKTYSNGFTALYDSNIVVKKGEI